MPQNAAPARGFAFGDARTPRADAARRNETHFPKHTLTTVSVPPPSSPDGAAPRGRTLPCARYCAAGQVLPIDSRASARGRARATGVRDLAQTLAWRSPRAARGGEGRRSL